MGAIRLQTLAMQLTTRKQRMQLHLDRQEGRGVDTAQNVMQLYKTMETHTSHSSIINFGNSLVPRAVSGKLEGQTNAVNAAN